MLKFFVYLNLHQGAFADLKGYTYRLLVVTIKVLKFQTLVIWHDWFRQTVQMHIRLLLKIRDFSLFLLIEYLTNDFS